MIVLVDADGETSRKRDLEAMVSDMPGTKMVAVAIQEFEAWLVADGAALVAVLASSPSKVPQQPESLGRGEAKGLLKDLSAAVVDQRDARLSLAEHLDLEVVAKKCPAFATCLAELQSLAL